VLHDKELIGDELALALLYQILLDGEGFGVGESAEVAEFTGAH
jgi:hypothetical protein